MRKREKKTKRKGRTGQEKERKKKMNEYGQGREGIRKNKGGKLRGKGKELMGFESKRTLPQSADLHLYCL